MKLDNYSKNIIRRIVDRQHATTKNNEVINAVFKKIKGKDKLDKNTIEHIERYIINTHNKNFCLYLKVQSGNFSF